jgi:KaiC/GvpD/RAD55 family RecA-like ATPase
MFFNTIGGLDKIFRADIKGPKVIMVSGMPGTMKSSFVYLLLTKYVDLTGEFGLYATLEETTDSHLNNMESIGLTPSINLQISDYTDFRSEEQDETLDYLDFTEKMIKFFKEKHGSRFTTFAFDSLGALYSLMPSNGTNMRARIYHFFKMLREQNLISFIIMERSLEGESHLLGNEGFLTDGIIVLGLKRNQGRIKRYLQVEKMRAVPHSMELHAMELVDSGMRVLGPIFDDDDK